MDDDENVKSSFTFDFTITIAMENGESPTFNIRIVDSYGLVEVRFSQPMIV